MKHMLFQELGEINSYDGIWACSSILHLPKNELLSVIRKMCVALKGSGIIYTSFKYGDFEGERNGRHFTDFTEDSFQDFIKEVPEIRIVENWITGDVQTGKGRGKMAQSDIARKSEEYIRGGADDAGNLVHRCDDRWKRSQDASCTIS